MRKNIGVIEYIREKYDPDALKLFRKFEKSTKKYHKLVMDRQFLLSCRFHETFPKILRIITPILIKFFDCGFHYSTP